jgi:hypothetical protein
MNSAFFLVYIPLFQPEKYDFNVFSKDFCGKKKKARIHPISEVII